MQKDAALPKARLQKRFSVSLDERDHAALVSLGQAQRPPLNLQYLVRLAVRNLLDQHAAQQLTFPLDRG